MIKKLTVAMQYGMLFLHPGQRSSHSEEKFAEGTWGLWPLLSRMYQAWQEESHECTCFFIIRS